MFAKVARRKKLEAGGGEKRIGPYPPRDPRGDSRGITRLSYRQVLFFFFFPSLSGASGRVRSSLTVQSMNRTDGMPCPIRFTKNL
ncbi:hypothetical protein BHE74_00032208 [Ensete ventricosum]|nr:hypothetical protein BHE74_00032208 [Ensete ventricosum]